MRAFDMSRFHRVIATDGRVSGSWKVAGGAGRNPEQLTVTPIAVDVMDEALHSGRVFYSNDFTILVDGEQVELTGPRNESKIADLEDAWDAVCEAMLLVAEVWRQVVGAVVSTPPGSGEGDRG